MRVEQTLEPGDPRRLIGRCSGDDRNQFGDRVVDGGTNGTRRAIDVLEGGRKPLDEGDGAFGRFDRLCSRDVLDFGDSLAYPRVRPPSERVAAKPTLESPRASGARWHWTQGRQHFLPL